jgi:WD40 repeat protein
MPAITQLHQIDLHGGHITKLRWSSDGRFLALPMQSGSIAIFDIESEQIAQTLGPHSGEVTAVAWDRKAQFILAASLDRSVGLWEVKSGQRAPFKASGHKEPVHSVEWTDEEAYAMTCSSDRVRALDGYCLLPGWTEEMENAVNRHTGFTTASCSCRTTFLLAMIAENGSVLLLTSLLSAAPLDSVQMREPARCMAWSPADEVLAVATGQSILLFRATQEGFDGPARELTGRSPHVQALAFSGDGTLLASHDADGLKVWEVESAKLIAELSNNCPNPGLAFHPTRSLLAAVTSSGTAFRLLDLSAIGGTQ